MIKIFKFWVQRIDKFTDWEPQHVFGKSRWVWWDNHENHTEVTDYTPLGEFMYQMPLILNLLIKALYLVPAWAIYIVLWFIWRTFTGLFIPESWLN